MSRLFIALAAASLAACASASDVAGGPPDYSAVATQPPSEKARLYANCVGQAAEAGAYARVSQDGAEMILFTCTGQPAQAFYDGLAARSAAIGSEFTADGRTYRSTNRVERNLFGVDYCSTNGTADVRCVITLNAGGFLAD
jgi:hypothetical protein